MQIPRWLSVAAYTILVIWIVPANSQLSCRYGAVEVGKWIVAGTAAHLPEGRTTVTSGTLTVTFSEATMPTACVQTPAPDPWDDNYPNIPSPPDLPALASFCQLLGNSSSSSASMSIPSSSSSSQSSTNTSAVGTSSSCSTNSAEASATFEPEQKLKDDAFDSGSKPEAGGLAAEAASGIGSNEIAAAAETAAGLAAAGAAAALIAQWNAENRAVNKTDAANRAVNKTDASTIPYLLNAKIISTQSTLNLYFGSVVNITNFGSLLDQVQSAFDHGQAPTDGTPYFTKIGGLSFNYTVVPGAGEHGTSAFNGTIALWQWYRLNGGSKLGSGFVRDADGNVVANVNLHNTYTIIGHR